MLFAKYQYLIVLVRVYPIHCLLNAASLALFESLLEIKQTVGTVYSFILTGKYSEIETKIKITVIPPILVEYFVDSCE